MAQQTVPVSHFLECSLLAALLQHLVNARALTVAGPKAKAQAASLAVAAVTPLESECRMCTTSTKPSVAPLLRLLRRYKAGFSTDRNVGCWHLAGRPLAPAWSNSANMRQLWVGSRTSRRRRAWNHRRARLAITLPDCLTRRPQTSNCQFFRFSSNSTRQSLRLELHTKGITRFHWNMMGVETCCRSTELRLQRIAEMRAATRRRLLQRTRCTSNQTLTCSPGKDLM